MSDKVREAFEAWAVEPAQSLHIERHPDYPDTYHFWTTELAWSGFRAGFAVMQADAEKACAASRAAALEEAARAMHPEIRSMLSRGEAAAAIRALAGRGA